MTSEPVAWSCAHAGGMQASRSQGAGQSVDALPVWASACGSRNCRTGGPEVQVSQRPGFSGDRARLPLASLLRLPPGAWGLIFRDPCPLSGTGRAVVACPRGVTQGSTGMPPGGTALPSFGGNGEGQEVSTGVQSGRAEQQGRQGALGDRSPRRASAQALPPALQRQGAPSQRTAGCGRAPPRTHRTEWVSDGRSDSGFQRISLAGGRGEGAERVDKGQSWGLWGRARGGGWGDGRSPSPSPSPQRVGRRLSVHSESRRHVSQLRATGHRAAAQAAVSSQHVDSSPTSTGHQVGVRPMTASLGAALFNNKM